MRHRLIDDGVRVRAGLDLAQNLERFEIEDGDIVVHAVAGEAFAEIVGDGDAVDAIRAGDSADNFVCRGVDDFGLSVMRCVQPVVGAVDIDIIPAAFAADLDFVGYFVGRRGADAVTPIANSSSKDFIVSLLDLGGLV